MLSIVHVHTRFLTDTNAGNVYSMESSVDNEVCIQLHPSECHLRKRLTIMSVCIDTLRKTTNKIVQSVSVHWKCVS